MRLFLALREKKKEVLVEICKKVSTNIILILELHTREFTDSPCNQKHIEIDKKVEKMFNPLRTFYVVSCFVNRQLLYK